MGAPTTSSYAALVRSARKALSPEALAAPPRLAPTSAAPLHMRRTYDGGEFVKKDVTLRLVPEDTDKERHIQQAKEVPFPHPSTRYTLTPDMEAAIQTMTRLGGPRLTAFRRKQVDQLNKIARATTALSAELKRITSDVPASVKHLRQGLNIGLLAVLFDAMGWQDHDLCRGLLRGFHVAGDLTGQKSNIFRPVEQTTPFTDDKWDVFCSHNANMAYLKICEQTLGSQAEKAKRQANAGGPGPLELLCAVQDKTSSEVETAHHMGAAMTTEELISAYSIDGIFPVRVAPSFGIWQGYKMVINKDGLESHLKDEKGNEIRKLRCIDDFKVNGVNAQTMLADKLFLPNFEFPARIGAEFFNKMGNDAPELILSLDDLLQHTGACQMQTANALGL